jgi:hypothetical protein
MSPQHIERGWDTRCESPERKPRAQNERLVLAVASANNGARIRVRGSIVPRNRVRCAPETGAPSPPPWRRGHSYRGAGTRRHTTSPSRAKGSRRIPDPAWLEHPRTWRASAGRRNDRRETRADAAKHDLGAFEFRADVPDRPKRGQKAHCLPARGQCASEPPHSLARAAPASHTRLLSIPLASASRRGRSPLTYKLSVKLVAK